jgi:hypothetical protein
MQSFDRHRVAGLRTANFSFIEVASRNPEVEPVLIGFATVERRRFCLPPATRYST